MSNRLSAVVVLILDCWPFQGTAELKPNDPGDARLVTSDIDHFWEAFDAMADGDPSAALQKLYIDRMNSGGTASDVGLLIGTEMYGLCEETPTEELGEWHHDVLKCIDGLPHIVAHELIHFEQPPIPDGQHSLLAQAIREILLIDDFNAFLAASGYRPWKL